MVDMDMMDMDMVDMDMMNMDCARLYKINYEFAQISSVLFSLFMYRIYIIDIMYLYSVCQFDAHCPPIKDS